jgi:ADP-heptose:LPS heptosyltransferase
MFWLAQIAELGGPVFAGLRKLLLNAPSPPAQWRKVLIANGGSTHIGDVLYRTPSLGPLKAHFPHWEIVYAGEPSTHELLRYEPAISSVLDLSRCGFGDKTSIVKKHNFDAILCTQTRKGASDLLVGTLSGIPNSAGYPAKGLGSLITHPVPFNFPKPFAAYFKDMVQTLIGHEGDWALDPVLHIGADDRKLAEAEWYRLGLNRSTRPVIGFFPFTRQTRGQWLKGFAAELATRLTELDLTLVLGGAPTDESAASDLVESLASRPPLRMRIPQNLRAVAAFIQKCNAVVCADSGPRHLAAAVGTPRFFPSNPAPNVHPVETGPYLHADFDFLRHPGSSPYQINDLNPHTCADMVKSFIMQNHGCTERRRGAIEIH